MQKFSYVVYKYALPLGLHSVLDKTIDDLQKKSTRILHVAPLFEKN